MAWISDYVHIKLWDEIINPCRNFNGDLAKLLGHKAMD